MTTLTLLLACTAAVLGIARIHHSNKLFWTLMVSMLLGFGLGSIVKSYSHEGKEINATTVIPMQGSSALTIIDPALLPDTFSANSEKTMSIAYAKPASQSHVERDIAVSNRTRNHFNPESDVGNIEPSNTS